MRDVTWRNQSSYMDSFCANSSRDKKDILSGFTWEDSYLKNKRDVTKELGVCSILGIHPVPVKEDSGSQVNSDNKEPQSKNPSDQVMLEGYVPQLPSIQEVLREAAKQGSAKKVSFGTINCFIISEHGIYLGVDSRVTDDHPKDEKIHVLSSDSTLKFNILVKENQGYPVIITGAGSKNCNYELWDKLDTLVMGGTTDIEKIAEHVQAFLTVNRHEYDRCDLLLAGYNANSMTYVVYSMGDGGDKVFCRKFEAKSDSFVFDSIGSGSLAALYSLRRLNTENLGADSIEVYTNIRYYCLDALVQACFYDECCGGVLNVLSVNAAACSSVYHHHLIDVLLDMGYAFPDNTVIFFSCEDYTDMNYKILDDILVADAWFPERTVDSNGFVSRHYPICLGEIYPDLNMFAVHCGEWCNAGDLFQTGVCLMKKRASVRAVTFKLKGKIHLFFMVMPDRGVLSLIRRGGLDILN